MMALGAVLAVLGWALATVPVLALNAYIRLASDCVKSGSAMCAGSTEAGNIPVVAIIMACMVAGPLFLGIAAATGRGRAWLVTLLLALPVIGGALFLFSGA